MKLYSINCYGTNYGIGVDEADAIQSYLFRHPELTDVDDIDENLKAKLILDDDQFEDIFVELACRYNAEGLSSQLVLDMLEQCRRIGLDLELFDYIGIYEVFELMIDDGTIYSQYDLSIEDIIKCRMKLKDVEEEYYACPIEEPKSNDITELLKFIGFYKLGGNGNLQFDVDDAYASYVYDDPSGCIVKFVEGEEIETFNFK